MSTLENFFKKYLFTFFVIYIACSIFYYMGITDPVFLNQKIVSMFFITLILMSLSDFFIPRKFSAETSKRKLASVSLSVLNVLLSKYLKLYLALGIVYLLDRYFGASADPFGIQKLPLYISAPLGILTMDFIRYWIHRFQHTVPFLWNFHSVHHSVQTLNTLNLYRSHPVDYFLRNILPPVVVFGLGFSFNVVFISTLMGMFAMWSHSGADLKSGIWNKIFSTNEVHRWHHAVEYKGIGYNFAVLFCFWDQIFGTYYLGDEDSENLKLGLRIN